MLAAAVVACGAGAVVLGIGKLARGQKGYYLGSVVRGVEDYYLDGEHTGVWIGAAVSGLGLTGPVAAEPLARILVGSEPASGAPLRATSGDHLEAAADDPTHHLYRALGARPAKPKHAARWTSAAFTVERYRTTFNVTAPNALGPRPAYPLAFIQWCGAHEGIRQCNPAIVDLPLRQDHGQGIA